MFSAAGRFMGVVLFAVESLFIVARIGVRTLCFGPCFVVQYLVSFGQRREAGFPTM